MGTGFAFYHFILSLTVAVRLIALLTFLRHFYWNAEPLR